MKYESNDPIEILLESLQNPGNPAPLHIIAVQRVLSVQHYDFNDEIRVGSIVVHEEVENDVLDFFVMAKELRFPIERVVPISDEKYNWDDGLSMSDNNTSGFNYRTIMGTNRLSNHAAGRAFDVNPRQNIYAKSDEEDNVIFNLPEGAVYDESAKGTLTKEHPLVIFMKERGWVWGGDWSKSGNSGVDYQHFEKK